MSMTRFLLAEEIRLLQVRKKEERLRKCTESGVGKVAAERGQNAHFECSANLSECGTNSRERGTFGGKMGFTKRRIWGSVFGMTGYKLHGVRNR